MKNLSTFLSVIAAALIIGIFLVAGLVSFQKKSDYIAVTGQSEVTVSPDRALLYFSINSRADTAEQAQAADASSVGKIQDALAAQGAGSVETAYYYLNRRTEWTNDGPVDKGYELSHTLKVTTGVADAGKTIETAVGAGANGVDRIEFLVSRSAKDAAVAEAMRQASLVAQQKAQKTTGAIGVRMGRVLKIEESSYWFVESNEPANTSEVPEEYQNSVISPSRQAVQGNVNVVYAVN